MTRLKILIRIIERDRRLRSFTDVIGHGLGPRTQYWLTCFFIVEFLVWKWVHSFSSFSCLFVGLYPCSFYQHKGDNGLLRENIELKLINSVALVVLASDSLEAVIPRYTSDQWKLLCFIVYVHFLPFSSQMPSLDVIGYQWAETNVQCPTAQFRSPPILVFIIIHWGIDYMGDHRNSDLLRCCYVSPLHCQSWLVVNIPLDLWENQCRLVYGLLMGWSSLELHLDWSLLRYVPYFQWKK